jgi:hypothetical protein
LVASKLLKFGVTVMHLKPYLIPGRLPLLIGLIQAMSVRSDYEQSLIEWSKKFSTIDKTELENLFKEHPEFFRCSRDDVTNIMGYSLIYRRFLPDNELGKRPQLAPEQTKMLLDVAVKLYLGQIEQSRDWRWRWSLLAPAISGFLGVLVAAFATIYAAQYITDPRNGPMAETTISK